MRIQNLVEMQIRQHFEANVLDLRIDGEVDANSSIELDLVVKDAIDAGHVQVTINCEGLVYISSAGLGVFISHLDDVKGKGGKFVFYNMADHILHVFQILGLDSQIEVVEDKRGADKLF